MSELFEPAGESGRKEDVANEDLAAMLLGKRQWTYLQRRYELTPRECEIAALVCQGLRNGSIAKSLRIKPGTVKTHTRNIYRKVHVKSKVTMLLRFFTDSRAISTQYDARPAIGIAE